MDWRREHGHTHHDHDHDHDHGHRHDHGHDHHHDHQVVPSDPALRTKALESLLVEKGLVDRAALDALVDAYENKIGPRNGARVVARAWVDPAYKQRLLANGTAAIAELGYGGSNGVDLRVLENTATVHNLVVCTLCSCYIWAILGLPPEDVLMVLSAAMDLHVTQIVDGTKGVHAILPKAIFQNR